MLLRGFTRLAAALIGITAFAASSAAEPAVSDQNWPERPMTLIVPFAAGGSTDAIGRIVAEGLRRVLGQPVLVDNRGGAGGSIGTAAIAEAEPDGYTIGMGTASTLAINPALYRDLPFDVLGDLAPVGLIASVPNIMSVNPSVDAADLAAFIALARTHPGAFSYASAGNGSVSHLLGEQFALATGLDIVHVPYKGAGPALTDVVSGQVDILFDNLTTSLPLVRAGRLRPLAVSVPARLPTLAEVPTFAEAGLEDMNWLAFFGLVAPKETPRAIIDRLNAALEEALSLPDIGASLSEQQAVVVPGTPDAFAALIEREMTRMRAVVADGGIHLD